MTRKFGMSVGSTARFLAEAAARAAHDRLWTDAANLLDAANKLAPTEGYSVTQVTQVYKDRLSTLGIPEDLR